MKTYKYDIQVQPTYNILVGTVLFVAWVVCCVHTYIYVINIDTKRRDKLNDT